MRLMTLLYLAMAVCGSASGVSAQVASTDSAEIYERLASATPSRRRSFVGGNKLHDAMRAYALFGLRSDTAGQARALLLAAEEYDGGRIDSLIVLSRRAVSLLRRPGADSSVLAQALGLLSYGLLSSRAPLDSAARYRAENLRLRRRLATPKQEARERWAHGQAFLDRRGLSDAMGKSFVRDSALHYLHSAVALARSAGDSATIAGSFGDIANAWMATSTRIDSALLYRQRGFAISSALKDKVQMYHDLISIIQYFRIAPLRDRSAGVTKNLDSVLTWSRTYARSMEQFGPSDALQAMLVLGSAHRNRGNLDSARSYYGSALEIAKQLKAPDRVYSVLGALATYHEAAGFVDSTLLLRRQRVTAARAQSSQALRNDEMFDHYSLADAHLKKGDLDSAMVWYRSATDTARFKQLVSPSPEALKGFASVHRLRGEPDSAIATYRQLLAGYSTAPPGWPSGIPTSYQRRTALLGEAEILFEIGMVDSAQMLIKRLLVDIPLSPTAEDARTALPVFTAWSKVLRHQGQSDSSLVYDTRALVRAQEMFWTIEGVEGHLAVAADHEALGMLDSARAHYRAAVTMSEQQQMRPQAVLSLGALASWHLSVDAPDSALTLARRAVVRATETASPWLLADARYRLGIIFGALGQSDSAATYLESTLGQRGRPVGPSLVALGNLRLRMGQADTARALLHTALRAYRASGARPAVAQTLTSLAQVEQRLGRPDSALAIAGEALSLARATHDRLTEGRAFAALGRARFLLGQTDSARTEYERSLAVFRATGFTRDARETLAELAELFRLRRAPGDLERATTYFDSAATTFDNARRRTGDDELAVTFAEQQTDIYGGWARAWLGRRGDVGDARATLAALGAVERGRGQALLQLLQPTATGTNAVGRAGTDLANEADSLLSTIRSTGSAALSYLQAGDSLFTWFIAPDGTVALLTPQAITAEELARLILSARRSFAANDARSAELDPDVEAAPRDSIGGRRDPADDLRRLATLLLPADLETRVAEGTSIVIVPHGAIASVPFAALDTRVRRVTVRRRGDGAVSGTAAADDSTTTSLGARHPLRFAPSFAALRATERTPRVLAGAEEPRARGRVWRATRSSGASPSSPRPRATRTLLAQSLVVGNPTMPFLYSGRSSTRSQLRPLPGAEAESRSIARQLGARVLTGAAATESSVRRRMARAPIIQLATHGLGYGTAAQARRSYVAFAPDSAQDGLLTLGELMDDRTLTLHAELVVLSACQTGLGNLQQAEGTIGLQRAFLAKGARSVLVSLWNVDDAATRLLMEHFYRAWLDPVTPRTKAQALREAQAAVRHTPGFAHPRYWAAFQLVGAE